MSTEPAGGTAAQGKGPTTWPLWEVFVRGKRGLSHVHVGSLHAPDAVMALRNARDVYTRRQEGVSIWVAKASDITASSPDERDAFDTLKYRESGPGREAFPEVPERRAGSPTSRAIPAKAA